MTRRLTRRAVVSCEGCWQDHLPQWGSTATVNGRTRTVCMVCAAILKRLGIIVTPNDDKEG